MNRRLFGSKEEYERENLRLFFEGVKISKEKLDDSERGSLDSDVVYSVCSFEEVVFELKNRNIELVFLSYEFESNFPDKVKELKKLIVDQFEGENEGHFNPDKAIIRVGSDKEGYSDFCKVTEDGIGATLRDRPIK